MAQMARVSPRGDALYPKNLFHELNGLRFHECSRKRSSISPFSFMDTGAVTPLLAHVLEWSVATEPILVP